MEMINNYRDFVEEFRGMYEEQIEPLINQGEYATAKGLLENIVSLVKAGGDPKVINLFSLPTVHSGLNFLGAVVGLYEKLGEKDFDKDKDTLHLRAYLSQTQLPTREEVMAQQVR